jgi:hypothetical protein
MKKYWSDQEIDVLRKLYPIATIHSIKYSLQNRSWPAIKRKAHDIGLLRKIVSDNRIRSESPTLQIIYWAAGVYEGEASCSTLRKDQYSYPRVTLPQKDPEILYRLQKYFGGRVTPSIRKNYLHFWACYSARAAGFLLTIYPILSKRRQEQVRKVLTLWR